MDFCGKTISQFCCNNGRELLSLMRLGAKEGIGFDIAENIIAQASGTAKKAGIDNCRFLSCNILDIPKQYDGCFDFILFTIGAITWFEDLNKLFQKVSGCLKPGGALFIHDFHPMMNMLPMPGEPGFDGQRLNQTAYSYFRKEPWIENEGMAFVKLNEYDYDIVLSDVYDPSGVSPIVYPDRGKTQRSLLMAGLLLPLGGFPFQPS